MKTKIIKSIKALVLTGLFLTALLPTTAMAWEVQMPAGSLQLVQKNNMAELHHIKIDVDIPGQSKLNPALPPLEIPSETTESTPADTPSDTTATTPADDGLIHDKVENLPNLTHETTSTQSTTTTPEKPGSNRKELPFTGNNPVVFYGLGVLVVIGGAFIAGRQYKVRK